MLNSAVLEVGFGILFVFLAVSLVSGAIVEALASMFKWRASTLLTGIKEMLNDQGFSALARDLYQHASINPRGTGFEVAEPSYRIKPGYIGTEQFANAFMDIIGLSKAIADAGPPPLQAPTRDEIKARIDQLKAKTKEKLDASIGVGTGGSGHARDANASLATASSGAGASGDGPMKQMEDLLFGIIERAWGDPKTIKTELENWFDNSMDRLSGAYKRKTQLITFLIALLVSVALNVDTIRIAEALWSQPSLTATLAKVTDQSKMPTADEALRSLEENLPVGWPAKFLIKTDASGNRQRENGRVQYGDFHFGAFVAAMAGWLITAIAALFGAPFWFDALQKVTRLKGAAASPDEKKAKQAAAA